jgi:hypothetical protein
VVPGSLPPLAEIVETARKNLAELPEEWKVLRTDRRYPVQYSPALRALRRSAAEAAAAAAMPAPPAPAT